MGGILYLLKTTVRKRQRDDLLRGYVSQPQLTTNGKWCSLQGAHNKLQSVVRSNYANNPARMQIIDAKDGKTIVYTIQQVPDPEDEEMMDEAMGKETEQETPEAATAE